MKNFIILTLKLFLVCIATSAVSFITMALVMGGNIELIYKVLISILFIAFTVLLTWNNTYHRGIDDAKKKQNKAYKGFLAGAIAMLPMVIVTVAYMFVTYNGFLREASVKTAESLYLVLYFVFIAYCPVLSSFINFNPALSIDFSQPAILHINDITMPNAVNAPLFFIPIVIFILVAGIGYIYGYRAQNNLVKGIKK